MAIIEGNYIHFLEHGESLLSHLYNLYSSNMFLDTSLICQGSEIFAHKAILAAASPLLRERIHEFGDSHARVDLQQDIDNIDVNVEDIKLLVEFMYRGQVCVPQARLSLFMELGNHFQILGLYKQTSNLGGQLPFLSQTLSPYTVPQHSFPLLTNQESFSYEETTTNLENDYVGHNFSGVFSNNSFTSPEKLTDSAIKQDKSFPVPVTNTSFSDLCTGSTSLESYPLLSDRNIDLVLEESNPKVSCDLQNFVNSDSVTDVESFPTINHFPSDFTENSLQVQSEHSKDLFEDAGSMSSSGASDPEGLFSNLSNQPNSFFNPIPTSSSDQQCLPSIPFQPFKVYNNLILPERHIRLKVKDSIGGVSLQDTSQVERALKLQIDTSNALASALCLRTEGDLRKPSEDPVESLQSETRCHVCSHCPDQFCSLDDLTHHMYDLHNIGVLYKCLLCSFKSPVENCLVDHGYAHLTDPDHRCCICGKIFKTRATIRNHLSCHASNKWFKCNECSAHYSQRNNLIKHLASEHRLGTDGNPIKEPLSCPHCTFETWAPHKLSDHKVRCHTVDKPFKCSHCSYAATERTPLVKHLRTHTQDRTYVCDSCGLSFITVSTLKRHCRAHTKEKPHTCKECGKQYADKKRLRDHYLKHKSIKPFKCLVCEYSCRRKDNLQSHIKKNHPNTEKDQNI